MFPNDPPTRHKQMRRLSPRNPLDHLRLLWWMLVMPHELQAYRGTFGQTDERRVGRWLVSTLIWLPLAIPALALALDIFPRGVGAFPTDFYVGGLFGLILAWAITGWLGNTDIASGAAGSAPASTTRAVILGVALAVVFGVAVGAAIGVADAIAGDVVFIVIAYICIAESVAFIAADAVVRNADTSVLGSVVGFVALGVTGFVGLVTARGVAQFVANLVIAGAAIHTAIRTGEQVDESLKTGRPLWTARTAFGALILVYAFLIWFSFVPAV